VNQYPQRIRKVCGKPILGLFEKKECGRLAGHKGECRERRATKPKARE
jgi:hypothetical protein